MLLAIDVGNTQTVFGLFDGDDADRAVPRRHRPHPHRRRARRAAAGVRRPRDARRDRPLLVGAAARARVRGVRRALGRAPSCSCSGPGVSTGMPIRYDDPREVGPDRIANAVAARERHGAPAVVVDFGTSTNFDVVSAAGEFAGGVLAPGHRGLDGRALRARRAAAEGAVRGARARDQPDDDRRAAVGARLRLRRPGRRDRRPDPRGARRAGRARRRDGRPRRPDRAALADDHRRRPGADAAGPAAGLGAQPAAELANQIRLREADDCQPPP